MSLFGKIKDVIGAVAPIIGSKFGPVGSAIGGVVGKVLTAPKSKTAAITGTQGILAGVQSIAQVPGFNGACYLQNHPDVAAHPLFANDPYLHYTRHGMAEGRDTSCKTSSSLINNFSGSNSMSLLPAIVNVGKTMPTVLPGIGNVVGKTVRAVGGAIGGALVVDQLGNVIGRTGRRRRSMNPLNPKAARRAIGRIKSLRKFAQRIESSLPKQRTKGCSTRSKAKCR